MSPENELGLIDSPDLLTLRGFERKDPQLPPDPEWEPVTSEWLGREWLLLYLLQLTGQEQNEGCHWLRWIFTARVDNDRQHCTLGNRLYHSLVYEGIGLSEVKNIQSD